MANAYHVYLLLSSDILYIRKQYSQYKETNPFLLEMTEGKIEMNKQRVFNEDPSVELVKPCGIGAGILRLDEDEKNTAIRLFDQENSNICFFTPASGSGSRMFQFLIEFLYQPNDDNRAMVERFVNHIEDFAFFHLLSAEWKTRIKKGDYELDQLITYLLSKDGINSSELPKGLVAFHYSEPFVITAFGEHLLQGIRLNSGHDIQFHFTVQKEYKEQFIKRVDSLSTFTGEEYKVTYSIQDPNTDVPAYLENGELLQVNGDVLTRPGGHGALINNLNSIEAETIFIKNIDNVQHFEKSSNAIETWKILGGTLEACKIELRNLKDEPSVQKLKKINERFELFDLSSISDSMSDEEIINLINRPIRVCGMVRNEGQPGGGPFWIKEKNGLITKQIVEKAQINHSEQSFKLLVKSTHFNPVMIALCPYSFTGEKFNLLDFVDQEKHFVVEKQFEGKTIKFAEHPGLWNGAMSKWISLFVEIPSNVFSPVKSVLDLLDDLHR